MSADGPATHWARTARPGEIAARIAELDRRAVSGAPGYGDLVMRTVSDVVAGIRTARAARLAALADRDRGAAAEVGRSGPRRVALVAAILAAALAAALYFSRAELDPVAALPWAALLVVACAVLMCLALLPVRAVAPPTTGVAAVVWSTVVLSGGTLTMAAVLRGVTEPTSAAYVAGVVGLVVLLVLAIAVTRAALRVDPDRRARTLKRIAAFPEEVAESGRPLVATGLERLRVGWEAVEPEVRARVEADLAAAHRVLSERGYPTDALPDLPGALVLIRTAIAVEPALEGALDPA